MAITLTLNNNEFTVNQVDLNAIINLSATAADSTEPGRDPDNFIYSWTVVDKPPTSTFALDQNVGRDVQGIMDVWGTVRVFCIATNPDTGETSETDPLIAPNEAFCDIKVTHSSTLLQKPAKSQRNWHDEYWSLVDYVANIRGNNIDVDFAFGRSDADPTTRTAGIIQLASLVDVSKGRDYDTNTYTAQQMANGEGPFYSIIPSALVGAILDGGALGIPPHDVGGENTLAAAIEIRSVIGVGRQNLSLLNDVDYSREQREGDRLRWDDTAEKWIPYEPYRFDQGIILNSANEGFTATDNSGEVGPILWTKDDNTYARLHYDIDDDILEVGDVLSFAPDTQKSIDLGSATQRWNTLFVSAFSIDMENGVISMDTGGRLQVSDGGVTKAAALIDNTSLITNGYVKWDGTNFITETLAAGEADITEVIAGSGLSGGGTSGSVTLVASDINTTHIDSTALITSADTFADSDTSIMTAAAIDDLIESKGYSTSTGDIEAVVAGTGLSGGGTSGAITLDVSGLTLTEFAAGQIQLGGETFVDTDNQLMSAAAIADYVESNTSLPVGDNRDIQLTDGSGNFVAANWQVDTSSHLIPIVNNAYDVGSTTNRVRKLWAYDAAFTDDVSVGDALSVSGNATFQGQAIFQDFSTINDNGAPGTLLLTAGENGVAVGSITLATDEVIADATTSGSEAKISLTTSTGQKATLTTQGKQSVNHNLELPSAPSVSAQAVLRSTDFDSGRTTTEWQVPTEKYIYSTHVSREVSGAATFTAGVMDPFVDASQACMYWVQNTSGQTLTLTKTHVHIGHMRNASLGFSLCKAANGAAAVANNWTQVGTSFTMTNSSGADNILGQSSTIRTTQTTLAPDEYIGLVVTNIPVANRIDKRIVITFECDGYTTFQ